MLDEDVAGHRDSFLIERRAMKRTDSRAIGKTTPCTVETPPPPANQLWPREGRDSRFESGRVAPGVINHE